MLIKQEPRRQTTAAHHSLDQVYKTQQKQVNFKENSLRLKKLFAA